MGSAGHVFRFLDGSVTQQRRELSRTGIFNLVDGRCPNDHFDLRRHGSAPVMHCR